MRAPYGLELIDDCTTCRLRDQHFFCDLPKTSLEAFDAVKFSASYPDGAILFSAGQVPRGVFLLCKGRVKLSITSSDGKALILKIANPGEVLGLHATVSGIPYEMTAECLHPCQVNFVRREDFIKFLREHGDACLQAAQHLSASCQAAFGQLRSLGLCRSARGKLAGALLELAAKGGEKTVEGTRVKLAMTHEEIGQVIGMSRETVTRTLSEFRSEQLAYMRGPTLVIRNRPALLAMISG